MPCQRKADRNVFKSDIQSATAGPQTAVPKTNAVKLANLPQGNKSTTTIKKASSISSQTMTAPKFRQGASTLLPKNRVNLSTGPESGVEAESKSTLNCNCQSFPATTFSFPWQTNLSYESLFCLGLSLLSFQVTHSSLKSF